MFTHIIFDLDGTLLNTIDDLTDAGNHVCAAHGWPTHTVDQFKRMVGNGIPNLVSRFTPNGLNEDELAGALAEFSAYYGEHKEDKTAPYAGIPELLATLKQQGKHLAVLSNKAHALAGPVVEHYFPGIFEYVQGALPDAPLKPDPTLLHALMKSIGAKPETTLFVGDSDVDVLTGKNGGLTVVGVLWGFRDRQELESAGADYVIEKPEELLGKPSAKGQGWRTAVCTVCWLLAAVFAICEAYCLVSWGCLHREIAEIGYGFVMQHYPSLADQYLTARALSLYVAVPLAFTLAPAIYLTRKLRKGEKRREHAASDQT